MILQRGDLMLEFFAHPKQGKQIHSQNKIPLLGDIPVVGHLFRNDTTQVHSVIRLFLIKASVVNNGISHG